MTAKATKTPRVELVPSVPVSSAERLERDDDTPAIGSWWWVFVRESEEVDVSDREDEEGPSEDVVRDMTAPKGRKRRWLGCVTSTGSNFAELEGYRRSVRIALDDFHKRCARVTDPTCYTGEKIAEHRGNVRKLMAQISEVCHRLGVPIHQALSEGSNAPDSGAALAIVHGVADAKQYQKDLVKAKEKTLPELFKKVEGHHEIMARWMRVEMIPSKAELERVKGVTDVLENKIGMVELYAGLAEEVEQVRKGRPAKDDEKVHLIQRRHYMDEECLARYEAGGMSFKDIGAFDKWIGRDDNLFRLFPFPRTVIAFRVRHHDRRSDDDSSIEAHIQLRIENEQNKRTFLYIRNGYQLWRVETAIRFDEELFPNKTDHDLLSDAELWINPDRHHRDDFVQSRRSIDAMRIHHQRKRDHAAWRLRQWHRAGCPGTEDPPWTYTVASGDLYEYESHSIRMGGWSSVRGNYKRVPPGGTLPITGRPGTDVGHDPSAGYRLLTPEDIYFDDAMTHIREVTTKHNQIAVIIQGLLSRSVCLHPHPPWEIWKPEGFAQGIELVYDVSRAVTAGEEIDFKAYRAQLNKSIRPGCYTLGQSQAWHTWMREHHGQDWRRYMPGGYGNSGPGKIARVVKVRRNGNCVFEWTRERQRPVLGWKPCEDRPGWRTRTHSYPPIPVRWECPAEHLTCVDAYTPGDYRMFFDDPRTREQYLKWAPILLAAEDWHHYRRLEQETTEEATAKPKRRVKAKAKKPKAKVAAKSGGLATFAKSVEDALGLERDDDDGAES